MLTNWLHSRSLAIDSIHELHQLIREFLLDDTKKMTGDKDHQSVWKKGLSSAGRSVEHCTHPTLQVKQSMIFSLPYL